MNNNPKAEATTRDVQPGFAPSNGSRFLAWMHRNHHGFFYGFYPCWNWKIGGVLVTLWMRAGLVKIYHDEGRNTECHPAETERAREAVMGISNDPGERIAAEKPTPVNFMETQENQNTGGDSLHSVVGRLRLATPNDFVKIIREHKRAGTFYSLCDAAGSRHGAGISSPRALGNLCEKIHGDRRNEYLAAFYESSNDKLTR